MSGAFTAKETRVFTALRACLFDERTSKNDCAVYACLLGHVRGRTSRPSRVRISQETGINSINVSRHTRKLSDLGYIKIKPTKGLQTNVYELFPVSDMGITAARVLPAPETPLTWVSPVTPNKELRARARASPEQVLPDVGWSPPSKGANHPGIETEERMVTANGQSESRSKAVAFGSPVGGFKSFQSKSLPCRDDVADAPAWDADDDLVQQLKRDFGMKVGD